MQRDFIEPGGFGESLGNDVAPLGATVPVVKRLLDGLRNIDPLGKTGPLPRGER
jgi:hypothetical protein